MTPAREEQLAAIKEKVIAANPEQLEFVSLGGLKVLAREIRLADVLLAAETSIKGCQLAIETDGRFIDIADKTYDTPNKEFQNTGVKWNLRADDLDQQSDECVAFLHSLLV